ncbi:BSD domain-containing protein [Euphorbia peplus]|nr:BSD domain-containing protein [Euphorbia peplus]
MDYWQKARSFAEEAARRTQEITKEAAKRSQDLSIGSSKISALVSETAKRSKEIASQASLRSPKLSEIAAEASKRADQIKNEAIKMADHIKGLAVTDGIAPHSVTENELRRFGITDELGEFVKEITISTFLDFPLLDDSEMSDVPTVSNVRQDLSQFQEKHAKLVLLSVKEISKLRYELCPRSMKERKFWRIYFMLVNNHIATYENQYVEDAGDESEELRKDKREEQQKADITPKLDLRNPNPISKASSTEQDLDVFLLGGDSDDGEDDDGAPFDDDFNKMVDSSDDEKKK